MPNAPNPQSPRRTPRNAIPPAPPPEEDSPSRRWIAYLLLFLIVTGLAGTAVWHLYRPGPKIAEKFWIAALVPDSVFLRQAAANQLRDYPTRDTAIALVVFLNAMNAKAVPPDPAKETAEEKTARQEEYQEGLEAAQEALKTLCLITGHSFGTYFSQDSPFGFSWSDLPEKKWGDAMGEVNGWAFEQFGQQALLNSGFLDFILDLIFSDDATAETSATERPSFNGRHDSDV